MDPVWSEIYSAVLTAAPYVIIAYALMWIVLFIFIIYSTRSLGKTEKQLVALEEAIEQLKLKS